MGTLIFHFNLKFEKRHEFLWRVLQRKRKVYVALFVNRGDGIKLDTFEKFYNTIRLTGFFQRT